MFKRWGILGDLVEPFYSLKRVRGGKADELKEGQRGTWLPGLDSIKQSVLTI